MKILPCMAKEIVLLHEDGKTFEMAPFQVFRSASGQTVIRIGRNTLWFGENGKFDGTECSMIDPSEEESQAVTAAHMRTTKGLPPDEPYFQPGSPGHESETRAWPSGKVERESGKLYTVESKRSSVVLSPVKLEDMEGDCPSCDGKIQIRTSGGNQIEVRHSEPECADYAKNPKKCVDGMINNMNKPQVH
jgi:hypothetical protein